MMVYNPNNIEKDLKDYNGGCWKCKKQLKLTNDQTNCDNCNSLIKWNCNSCHEIFNIVDKESNKKLKECKICGYFICPYCSVCYWNCNKFEWQKQILQILKKDIPIGTFPSLTQRVDEIVEYIENIKTSIDRKVCCRNVPISYSKGRIKKLVAKVEGFRIKNIIDRDRFLQRIKDATDLPIRTDITIDKIREDGSYGQEYRDALNLLVCMGKFKINWIKKEGHKDYCVFTREDIGTCKFFNSDNLILKVCPKCKKIHNKEKENCDICIWDKGKKIGESVKLKERLNNCDTCQMYRGNFKRGNGRD